MENILVVEDDQTLAVHIGKLLKEMALNFVHVATISELDLTIDERSSFGAIILDRLLGGVDTKSRVQQIKRKWPATPVLVLSAINTPLERAELLNQGADDYLGKPFLSQELIARLRALMRRVRADQTNYREVGDVVIDLQKRIVIKGARQEHLPAKEFLLLKMLSDDIGRVLSKNELLDSVWSGGLDLETNVVESTVTNLRKRLSHVESSLEVRNSRNVGYWIES